MTVKICVYFSCNKTFISGIDSKKTNLYELSMICYELPEKQTTWILVISWFICATLLNNMMLTVHEINDTLNFQKMQMFELYVTEESNWPFLCNHVSLLASSRFEISSHWLFLCFCFSSPFLGKCHWCFTILLYVGDD